MRQIVNHCFDGGGLVTKFLGGDTSVIVVKKMEDDWAEWCNFSCEGVSKGGKIFGIYVLDDLLDEGSFKK